MKRFYCTICKKVKRVRKFPVDISTPQAELPTNRVGTCSFHHVAGRNQTTREYAKVGR